MSDDTFLDIDTSDAVEPQAADTGEHLIRIIGYSKDQAGSIVRTSDKGNRWFKVMFDLPNMIEAKSFGMFFMVPDSATMDDKQLNSAKWKIESFKKAFGIDGPLNFESAIGLEGYALLRKTNNEQYGEQNDISKFITPA
jgi:hypothetical protein